MKYSIVAEKQGQSSKKITDFLHLPVKQQNIQDGCHRRQGKFIFALNLPIFITDKYFYCQIIPNFTYRNHIYWQCFDFSTTMVVMENLFFALN